MIRLLCDALELAPRERILVDLACAVLCVAGVGLLGAAAFHAVADAAGPQAARLWLGVCALVLAGLVWAVGAIRQRNRNRRAAIARAQLIAEVTPTALMRTNLASPAAAFVLAFLAGRKS